MASFWNLSSKQHGFISLWIECAGCIFAFTTKIHQDIYKQYIISGENLSHPHRNRILFFRLIASRELTGAYVFIFVFIQFVRIPTKYIWNGMPMMLCVKQKIPTKTHCVCVCVFDCFCPHVWDTTDFFCYLFRCMHAI